jgi:hypothetical protein
MGFYSDWIEQALIACADASRYVDFGLNKPGWIEKFKLEEGAYAALLSKGVDPDDYLNSASLLYQAVRLMSHAKIIRMGGASLFLDVPPTMEQDFVKWFRLPYKCLYIQLDSPVEFKGWHDETGKEHPNVKVKGISIVESNKESVGAKYWSNFTFDEDLIRIFQINFLIPLPDDVLNYHAATFGVWKDNQTSLGGYKTDKGTFYNQSRGFIQRRHEAGYMCNPVEDTEIRSRMVTWLIHAVNFLSSPSVKLMPVEPEKALQKARMRKGKQPLPGWYEIAYRKSVKEYTKNKFSEKQYEHSYRYDVRAHQMVFKKGRMAGRVLWCPEHQRGLKHELYKPKTYRVGHAEDQVERWKG